MILIRFALKKMKYKFIIFFIENFSSAFSIFCFPPMDSLGCIRIPQTKSVLLTLYPYFILSFLTSSHCRELSHPNSLLFRKLPTSNPMYMRDKWRSHLFFFKLLPIDTFHPLMLLQLFYPLLPSQPFCRITDKQAINEISSMWIPVGWYFPLINLC